MQVILFVHLAYNVNQVINNTTTSYSTSSNASNPQPALKSAIRKPALGPSFTALTDATLLLSKYDQASREPMSDYDGNYTAHVAEVSRSRTNVSM